MGLILVGIKRHDMRLIESQKLNGVGVMKMNEYSIYGTHFKPRETDGKF